MDGRFNTRATANSQGHGADLAMWEMGVLHCCQNGLLRGHENVDDENAG